MREIKFRAWSKEDEEMGYDVNVCSSSKAFMGWQSDNGQGCYVSPRDNRYVLMQFTGLKDKNGKEIYEGDIIEHLEYRFAVKPITPLNRLAYFDDNETDDFMSMSEVDWEVIGNIYESPELLNPSPL